MGCAARKWLGLVSTAAVIILFQDPAVLSPPGGRSLDATERLLEELTNAHGVPGFEGPVRDILRREWRDLLTDLHTDGLGNLIGSLRGSSDSPRVLLMAHMDEVGV